ncbi:MAG: Hsp33 family molecular chaperone HslO [Firmicutes bacterium]|nr:Hsp33 family molecular chaperone HslO [Bacillota bacterium]
MNADYRIRATAADGLLRTVAVNTTVTARQAQQVHDAWPLAAAAMGRLLSVAAILAGDVKAAGARLTVEVDGQGPLGRVVAEVLEGDKLRARVQHPQVELPLRDNGKFDVGQAIGIEGTFRVIRQEGAGRWYQSQVPLRTGEIGDDFLYYLTQSEQIPSAVSVGVLVGTDGLVTASAAVLVQALPGCPESLVEEVAARFQALEQISRRVADGDSLETLIRLVVPEPIHWAEAVPIAWACWCSEASVLEALKALPATDLEELIADGGAEVTCHYCRRRYPFSASELAALKEDRA